MNFCSIDTVSASDLPYEEFLHSYVHKNRPVVVSDAVTQWPALKKWTPEYFKTRFGSTPVAVAYDRSMPFDQFIDAVMASSEQHPGPYMFRLFLHEHLPELLDDVIPQNQYAYPRRYASPLMPERVRRPDGYLKLLIGGPGSKFPVMHYDGDNAHATVTEIYGDKEMILYAPEDTPYLYPNPEIPNTSLISHPCKLDIDRFPLFAKATQYRAVLGPGQTVFIPSHWWHTARPVNPSVSVCTNILDGSNWRGFVTEACAGSKGIRQGAKRAYLTMLGAALGLFEQIQSQSPEFAHALRVPEIVAPVSSDVAPEPSAHQLKIRIPTA